MGTAPTAASLAVLQAATSRDVSVSVTYEGLQWSPLIMTYDTHPSSQLNMVKF